MSMKINRLEIENVKRIKAVKLEPVQNGLTIIGGDNQQGKTSVLDSIAWAIGATPDSIIAPMPCGYIPNTKRAMTSTQGPTR